MVCQKRKRCASQDSLKRQRKATAQSRSNIEKEKSTVRCAKKKQVETSKNSKDYHVPCGVCGVKFSKDKSGRLWIQCQSVKCLKWFHNSCQGLEEKFKGRKFVCIQCD